MAPKRSREPAAGDADEAAAAPSAPGQVGRLLFLLAGQSNMAGRAELPSPAANTASSAAISADVTSFHQREESWRAAGEPLHADKPERAGAGPGLPFARELLRRLEPREASRGVGLVPCAWGGSELARWEEGGDLRAEAVRRVGAALEAEPHAVLAGILWHQGESDSGEGSEPAGYEARLKAALDGLRSALGVPSVPLVLGELGYFLPSLAADDARFVRAGAVNAAILRAAAALGSCECVSAHGLGHRGDRLHFDGPAVEALGARYAAAWLRLAGHAPGGEPPPPQQQADDGGDCDAGAAPFSFPEDGEPTAAPAPTEAAVMD